MLDSFDESDQAASIDTEHFPLQLLLINCPASMNKDPAVSLQSLENETLAASHRLQTVDWTAFHLLATVVTSLFSSAACVTEYWLHTFY